jgi:membrane protein
MAIFQGLLALITRSLGSILSALFGWAVVALFGPTSSREKVWLSALVGAAAAWPILILGVIWPRVAATLLTFAPLPTWIPSSLIRAVWVALAVIVPFALGTAVAARSRGPAVPIPGTRKVTSSDSPDSAARHAPVRESKIVRLFRGIPITLAIAASFMIVFITVPLQRLLSMIRRQVDIDVPLVTDAKGYPLVAEEIAATLSRHGVKIAPTTPGWMVTAPSRILSRLGGPSFDAYVPRRFTQFRGPRLEVMLYPNGLLLRGSEQETAWAHGLLVEALTDAPAYQTFDPAAQDIERQIRRVWAVFGENPSAHTGARVLVSRLDEIVREIRELPVGYDEWQIVYRQALQLDRALRGRPQLLEATTPRDGTTNLPKEESTMANGTARSLPLRELIGEITAKATLLAKKEVELVKTELKADLTSELATVKGLGLAVLVGVLGLNMFLVAGVLALVAYMPGWLAALLIGGVLVVAAGILGYASWARRVTNPLAATRKTLKEDAQWAKERLA